jgi:predicted transcriptional regulator
MSKLAQEKDRVYIGAQVDREHRDQLVKLAHERDRSVSSIIRRALAAELEREPNIESGTSR